MLAQVYVRVVALILAFARFAFAANSRCTRKYTVKKGDFCNKISQEQHVSTYQLRVTNPSLFNRGCGDVHVGLTICLGRINQDCLATHNVKAGDTCLKIAAANKLSLKMLLANNPQLNHTTCEIDIGEVLCIAKTVKVPPTIPATPAPTISTADTITPPPPPSTTTVDSTPTSTTTSSSSPTTSTVTFPGHRMGPLPGWP